MCVCVCAHTYLWVLKILYLNMVIILFVLINELFESSQILRSRQAALASPTRGSNLRDPSRDCRKWLMDINNSTNI